MLYFAYDGTIHGDWVAHYAVRLALRTAERSLRLVHVPEEMLDSRVVEQRIEAIADFCQVAGVSFTAQTVPQRGGITTSLIGVLPRGPDVYVVSGTRSRSRREGYLAGTVAEKLLHSGLFHALAVRVVQPGLLGWPRDMLIPVAGHPRGFASGLPFLTLFAPDIERLHLLFVQSVRRAKLAHLTPERAEPLLRHGRSYLERIERELVERLPLGSAMVDAHVVLADDVAREIVNHANHVHTRLLYVGASERSFTERVLRGSPLERLLASPPCDVAVYRGIS